MNWGLWSLQCALIELRHDAAHVLDRAAVAAMKPAELLAAAAGVASRPAIALGKLSTKIRPSYEVPDANS
jgi:hypothetical protein